MELQYWYLLRPLHYSPQLEELYIRPKQLPNTPQWAPKRLNFCLRCFALRVKEPPMSPPRKPERPNYKLTHTHTRAHRHTHTHTPEHTCTHTHTHQNTCTHEMNEREMTITITKNNNIRARDFRYLTKSKHDKGPYGCKGPGM